MKKLIVWAAVELTAGDSQGALLPVKRVELEVHRAGKSQRHPAGKAVSGSGVG